jgi:hypothetical protein
MPRAYDYKDLQKVRLLYASQDSYSFSFMPNAEMASC